ncbi:MAG: hypothetical protein M3Q10_18185 [Chloroflexota bacterium]|nr:hypothetical protein [Chloroflexota bacterium]
MNDRADAAQASENDDPFAIIDEIRALFANVSEEAIARETTKAIAEVRAEMAEERARAVGVGG